jgi:F-type H+-transporting ATPase subunit gamma
MANRRVLVKRRKAVANIRKITRTMQLIATARFQAAFTRVTAAKPYVEKLAELVGELPTGGEGVAHPLLAPADPKAPAALLVLTSHRGLCGGYNGNVLRTAIAALDEVQAPAPPPELHAFGKKGIAYFRFLRRALASSHLEVSDAPRYDQVEPVANELMARFLAGEISSVAIVHMRFFSAGSQSPEVVPLLPLAPPAAHQSARRGVELEFHPDPKTLLDELLPATVRIRLYQAFLEAAVSEQSARMVAMKAATDAAEDTIKALTRKYNRARQTHITMELLDIVGGANALA